MVGKPFVFVLMPFNKSFDDIYQLGIKATCEELGCYCERVDEQHFEERISDRIYNQINKADIIIADMSDQNPNVFYETGYSHALQKRVILLTKNSTDIPFDLKHHHHIVYLGEIMTLREKLKKRLYWFITNPNDTKLPSVNELQYFIQGKQIVDGATITIKYPFSDRIIADVKFQIDLFNPNKHLVEIRQKYTLITSKTFKSSSNEFITTIPLPDDRFLHIHPNDKLEILPEMWFSISFDFTADRMTLGDEKVALRIHSGVDIQEVSFIAKLAEFDW